MGELLTVRNLRDAASFKNSIADMHRILGGPWLNINELLARIADAVQDEVEERCMMLPLGADGKPIHVGDVMVYSDGDEFTVGAVGPRCVHYRLDGTDNGNMTSCTLADAVRHKPPTMEEVVEKWLTRIAESGSMPNKQDIRECCDELNSVTVWRSITVGNAKRGEHGKV